METSRPQSSRPSSVLSLDGKATKCVSAGEAVEEFAGRVEMFVAFFFGAKFGRMGDKAAAGTTRGMFDMQHFVIQDVFDDKLGNGRAIHAAIEDDLVGAGIVGPELAAPTAAAPGNVRPGQAV